MPSFCSVVNCSTRAGRDKVSFFRFPSILRNYGSYLKNLSEVRRKAWVIALRRGPLTESQLRNGRVCCRHFQSGAPASLDDTTHPDWIPNQNLGYDSSTSTKTDETTTFQPYGCRKRKRLLSNVETSECPVKENSDEELPDPHDPDISARQVHENGSVSISVQSDLTKEHLKSLHKDLKFSNSKILSLKTKLDNINKMVDFLIEETFEST